MAEATYSVESFRTAEVPPHERADCWSEHVTGYQGRLDYRYPHREDFQAGTVRQRTEAYQLVEFWSDQVRYARTAGLVRADPDEDYRLLVPITGALVVRQDDREVRLTPGTGGLITLSAPSELLHEASTRAFIMTIPAREVNSPLNLSAPLSAGLDLSAGLGRVVADMVAGAARERGGLGRVQFDALSDRIVELLCMLVAGDDRPDAPGHLVEVEALARRYVRAHAADPGLNGITMARELGWSLRQVQLALQRAGTTPRELIREERLRLARDRLQNPAYRHMSITELAHASGFSSVSALSNGFRHRYGMSPREMRLDG
ncbi:AraC family transcriptional regulator [Actinomadura fulvescens]|uniref:Helix-turn-helix domain-containing protein n=1 Tax=Actinomadura fulvescens TaxID=46160 RepID=A0ABN3PIA8_9ACTN